MLPEEFPGLAPWALLLTKVRDGHAACPMPSPTSRRWPTSPVGDHDRQGRAAASAPVAASEAAGGAGGPPEPTTRRARRPGAMPAGAAEAAGVTPGAPGPHPVVAGGGHVWPWPP